MEPWTSNALTPEQFRDELVEWCRNKIAALYDREDSTSVERDKVALEGLSYMLEFVESHLRAATFHPIPPDGAHN
jgi:hypothetical protein